MKDHRKRITGCLILLLCLSVLLSGCGSSMGYGVKAIETLVEQEYSMAFRNDDPTAYYIIGAIQATATTLPRVRKSPVCVHHTG